MFTGLIEARGRVKSYDRSSGQLWLACPERFSSLSSGDSLAVDGVCLTVEEKRQSGGSAHPPFQVGQAAVEEKRKTVEVLLCFQLGEATIQGTNFSSLRAGQMVNLERPLTLNQALGGHLVSGHIDAAIKLLKVRKTRNGSWWQLEIPRGLEKYIIEKGSAAINGVSLTIARVEKASFWVFLIPQTLRVTNLGSQKVQARLNLEVDMLAKYTAKLLAGKLPQSGPSGKITISDWLRKAGFSL